MTLPQINETDVLDELYGGRIGMYALPREPDMRVGVYVLGARRVCGRTLLLVSPIEGTGSTWVNATSVILTVRPGDDV